MGKKRLVPKDSVMRFSQEPPKVGDIFPGPEERQLSLSLSVFVDDAGETSDFQKLKGNLKIYDRLSAHIVQKEIKFHVKLSSGLRSTQGTLKLPGFRFIPTEKTPGSRGQRQAPPPWSEAAVGSEKLVKLLTFWREKATCVYMNKSATSTWNSRSFSEVLKSRTPH